MHHRALATAQWLMWLMFVPFLAVIALGSQATSLFAPLNIATQLLPAVVCWLCVRSARGRRTGVVWLAVAETLFAFGNIVLAVAQARSVTLPVPSLADIGYMGFYPAALVAIFVSARRDHRRSGAAVWLDSCIGGLAAASAVAVLLKPAFSSHHHSALSATVSLFYPVGDLLLVFAVVAVASLWQGRLRTHWLFMLGGLLVFTCADVVYDLQIAEHSYAAGTPLDALWAVGLSLMSMWAARAAPHAAADPGSGSGQPPGPLALSASAAAAVLSLTVLIIGTLVKVTPVATVLAASAIAGSVFRTQRALRYQQRLSELRREARTLERLVEAQDAERARIADDVHDDSIQALAAVDMRLGALRRRLRHSLPEEVVTLDAAIGAVHQAGQRLRSLMFELETPAVEADLAGALRDAAGQIFADCDTAWTLVEHSQIDLPVPARVAAYRIAREALVNVRKHADAEAVEILIDATASGFRVDVTDNGVGVAAAGKESGRRHFGMVGMRDRAEAAGGWWRTEPGPSGVGTHVSFFVPQAPPAVRGVVPPPERVAR